MTSEQHEQGGPGPASGRRGRVRRAAPGGSAVVGRRRARRDGRVERGHRETCFEGVGLAVRGRAGRSAGVVGASGRGGGTPTRGRAGSGPRSRRALATTSTTVSAATPAAGASGVQRGERAAGEAEADGEDAEALGLVAPALLARRATPKVSGRWRRCWRGRWRAGRRGWRPGPASAWRSQQEQHDVGDGAEHADGAEAHHLAGRARGGACTAASASACSRSAASGRRPEASARPTRHTPLRSSTAVRDDVDPRVGVVDPVDRHLVDAQAGALGEHQQLGVEEPAGVLDQRQQRAGRRRPAWP